MNRILSRAVTITMLAAVAVGGYFLYLGISSALYAENSLHAINLTTIVVDRFVQTEQRWPQSWNELRAVEHVEAPSMFDWPGHFPDVQDYVTIDFGVGLKSVASQSVEDFNAIRSMGSCYPYKHYGFVADLIATAEAVADIEDEAPLAEDEKIE